MHILLKLILLVAVLMFGNLDLFCVLCESDETSTISNKDLALSFGILVFIALALTYAAHCDPSNIYNLTDPGELMKISKSITPDSQDWTVPGTNHHVHYYVPGDDKFFNEKK